MGQAMANNILATNPSRDLLEEEDDGEEEGDTGPYSESKSKESRDVQRLLFEKRQAADRENIAVGGSLRDPSNAVEDSSMHPYYNLIDLAKERHKALVRRVAFQETGLFSSSAGDSHRNLQLLGGEASVRVRTGEAGRTRFLQLPRMDSLVA